MEDLLTAKALSVHYHTRKGPVLAVDGVTFGLAEGQTLGVVGETGCGKSTLGKAILGVLPPRTEVSGSLQLRGKELLHLPEAEYRRLRGEELALIFQDPMTRLDPLMTIRDHFIETVHAHDKTASKAEAAERAAKVLRSMGIPESRLDHYPHEFSGGMRQRIMIAMALSERPSLLIADEPTSALDITIQAQVLTLMKELIEEIRTSILFISHDLGVIAEVCDRVAVMYAGKVVEDAPVGELFAKPLHPYTQGLLESIVSMDSLKVEVGAHLPTIPGTVPDLLSPPSGCRFHPRCKYAFDRCSREDPSLRTRPAGHPVACHLYDEGVPHAAE